MRLALLVASLIIFFPELANGQEEPTDPQLQSQSSATMAQSTADQDLADVQTLQNEGVYTRGLAIALLDECLNEGATSTDVAPGNNSVGWGDACSLAPFYFYYPTANTYYSTGRDKYALAHAQWVSSDYADATTLYNESWYNYTNADICYGYVNSSFFDAWCHYSDARSFLETLLTTLQN